jgi:hypothetical protein
MAHMPINHPLRPFYRVVAGGFGLYVLLFGVIALVRTAGTGAFAHDGLPGVLGIHANRAFAVISVVAGIVLVGGAIVGGNLDRWINLVGGIVYLAAGLIMLAVLRTDLNLLGFTVTTCIVSFVIGSALLTAGLYGQVGPVELQEREERFRHGEIADPDTHVLGADNVPRAKIPV